jgi:hypothetical protein
MLPIADPLLELMYRDLRRRAYTCIALAIAVAIAVACITSPSAYTIGVGAIIALVLSLLFLSLLWETRYRMSKGTFGQRPSEAADIDRWLMSKGGKRLKGMKIR